LCVEFNIISEKWDKVLKADPDYCNCHMYQNTNRNSLNFPFSFVRRWFVGHKKSDRCS